MVVQGTITNLSDRLQAYNANNALMLNLWLTPEGDSRPFLFAIEGASLEGGKSEPIKFVEKKHTVFEGTPRGIYRVEQVYDIRTAPVKRVDRLELGYTSARHNKAELQMSAFSTAAAAAEGAAAGVAPGSTPGAPVGPSTGGGPPGPGGRGGMSTPGAGNDGAGAGPADRTFNGLVRRRYIHLTAQVRAVPVGMTIIADQAYVQDVLTAIANSKIRFQTVQTHLARFRSSLAYSTTGSSSGPMPPGGMEGSGPMPPTPGGPGFGGAGGAPMPPRGGPAVGVPGFGGPGFGGPGFGGPPTGGFGGPANAPRSSNEDTVASNLIELSIYGIASLYEKFDPNAVKDGSTTVTPKENVTPNEKMPEAKVPPREVAPTDPNAIPDKGDPKDGPAKNDSAIDPKVVPGKGEPKEVPAKNEPAIDPKGSNKQ